MAYEIWSFQTCLHYVVASHRTDEDHTCMHASLHSVCYQQLIRFPFRKQFQMISISPAPRLWLLNAEAYVHRKRNSAPQDISCSACVFSKDLACTLACIQYIDQFYNSMSYIRLARAADSCISRRLFPVAFHGPGRNSYAICYRER